MFPLFCLLYLILNASCSDIIDLTNSIPSKQNENELMSLLNHTKNLILRYVSYNIIEGSYLNRFKSLMNAFYLRLIHQCSVCTSFDSFLCIIKMIRHQNEQINSLNIHFWNNCFAVYYHLHQHKLVVSVLDFYEIIKSMNIKPDIVTINNPFAQYTLI